MPAQQLLSYLDLALLLVLALLPSIFTAISPHPSAAQNQIYRVVLIVLGRLSVLRHGAPEGDSPGTLHMPLTRQPRPLPPALYVRGAMAPRPDNPAPDGLRRGMASACPDGMWRCGGCGGCINENHDCPGKEEIRGQRLPLRAVACLALLAFGCASTAIDQARLQYASALKVAVTAQGRFKTLDARFQLGIGKAARTKEEGQKLLTDYRERRKTVERQVYQCQSINDEAAELLLLNDQVAGVHAAKSAQLCAAQLRDVIAKLFDGGI